MKHGISVRNANNALRGLPEHVTRVILVNLLVTRDKWRTRVGHVTRVCRDQELGGQRGHAPRVLRHFNRNQISLSEINRELNWKLNMIFILYCRIYCSAHWVKSHTK